MRQRAQGSNAVDKNSRLRVLGIGQGALRALKEDLAQGKPEDLVGLFEGLASDLRLLVQSAAHTDELGALAREKECNAHRDHLRMQAKRVWPEMRP